MAALDSEIFAVTGPVQAEILVLMLVGGAITLTGPCGAAPWYVELARNANPTEVVTAITRVNVGEPAVVHSTSWRHARGGVVLTFVAVVDEGDAGSLQHLIVKRAELARGEPSAAPRQVPAGSVIEHGLRHLAWLVHDDSVVADALPDGWLAALTAYLPEPFRQL
ncbi:MAG: hypothetical protein ACTHJW_07050 [Streptosporangiaceae bacterium]